MTIEDCLEILLGYSMVYPEIQVNTRDLKYLTSIRKQLVKGISLTDRQYERLKLKLLNYKNEFTEIGINLEACLPLLRQPIREIDRTKSITIKNIKVFDDDNYKNTSWIEIKFPYNKKTIEKVKEIKKMVPWNHYTHKTGTTEHYFKFSEKTVYYVIEYFKNKNYEIDPEIIQYYDKLIDFINNSESYVPGIYNYEFKNCTAPCVNHAITELGTPSPENILLYKDRQHLYGLSYIDKASINRGLSKYSILSQKIAQRKKQKIFVDDKKWSFDSLIIALDELERYPLIIMLPSPKSYRQTAVLDALIETHKHFKNLVDPAEISVMYRASNNSQDGRFFNEYVKTAKLNNPLTTDTKIVYISGKLPKPMLASDWKPLTLLNFNCEFNFKHEEFELNFDLIVYYDTIVSPWLQSINSKQYTSGIHIIK